jgi:hypothetical protein
VVWTTTAAANVRDGAVVVRDVRDRVRRSTRADAGCPRASTTIDASGNT